MNDFVKICNYGVAIDRMRREQKESEKEIAQKRKEIAIKQGKCDMAIKILAAICGTIGACIMGLVCLLFVLVF